MNLLDNTTNQPFRFKTKTWVEINDKSRGTYRTNIQVKFKTMMVKVRLCDYSDAYIFVGGTIKVLNTEVAANPNNRKDIIIKQCVWFTECIIEISRTQIDNAKETDVVILMYNFIEYSDNYSKTSGRLWQYYRDWPDVGANGSITDFPANNNSNMVYIWNKNSWQNRKQ